MNNLKKQLIKLGSQKPELQEDLRPVIAELEKEARVPKKMDVNTSSFSGPFQIAEDYGFVELTFESTDGTYNFSLNKKFGFHGFIVCTHPEGRNLFDTYGKDPHDFLKELRKTLPSSFSLDLFDGYQDGVTLIEFNTK